MNDTRRLILETAERMFSDQATIDVRESAEAGTFPRDLWAALMESGLLLAGISESAGGVGGPLSDSLAVLRCAGRHGVPGPVAETLIATWMLGETGLSVPEGVLSLAIDDGSAAHTRMVEGGWLLSGTLRGVPWAQDASAIVVVAESEEGEGTRVCVAEAGACSVTNTRDMSGEARCNVVLDEVVIPPGRTAQAPRTISTNTIRCFGALCRSTQISGALERVLELTVEHANVREQFGRPIAGFQAVRQQIAVLATQVAAAERAASFAAETVELTNLTDSVLPVGIAKSRTGEAAGVVAGIAHQVHGAMGITHEHSLHHFTRRLWTWRDDYGSERYWNARIGEVTVAGGADALWPLITTL